MKIGDKVKFLITEGVVSSVHGATANIKQPDGRNTAVFMDWVEVIRPAFEVGDKVVFEGNRKGQQYTVVYIDDTADRELVLRWTSSDGKAHLDTANKKSYSRIE